MHQAKKRKIRHGNSTPARQKNVPEIKEPAKFNSTSHPLLFSIFLAIGLFTLIALISFSNRQTFFGCEGVLECFATGSNLAEHNLCGKLGATFAVVAFNFFGIAAFMLPAFAFIFAYYMLRSRANVSMYWKSALMFFLLTSGSVLLRVIPDDFYGYTPDEKLLAISSMPQGPGGGLGNFLLNDLLGPALGIAGTATLAGIIYLFCFCSLLLWSPQKIARAIAETIAAEFRRRRQLRAERNEYKRRMLEERRRAALEAQERLRENRTAANSAIPMRADAPVAILPEPRERDDAEPESAEPDFSDVNVAENAIPEISAEPLGEISEEEKEENENAKTVADAEENPSENATLASAENYKTIGTLRPFPHEEFENVSEDEPENVLENAGEENFSEEKTEIPPPCPAPIPPAGELKVVIADELEKAENPEAHRRASEYEFPPLALLKEPPQKSANSADEEDYRGRGQQIIDVLAQFRIEAQLASALRGPTITRYEITPGVGVKVQKILNLQNEIAMGLRAQSVRIAPVPEHGTIGVEIGNQKPSPVYIREILESKAWHEQKFEIPIILGKDVTGKPVLMDLARMPHGLIAGSTGSGKSVCVNGIVTSILYSASPDDVRLVMVDPKVVELQVYNKIPHMLIPVITDAKKVPGALKWLINEMERRYQLLQDAGVRNIVGYNAKLIKDKKEAAAARALAKEVDKELSSEEHRAIADAALSVPRDDGVLDESRSGKKMPYIVCIVDEFADLMMQAPADIEAGVARLAAKARAAGIHLLLATQRPDAKVVTGIIKANLPVRIAFKVTSGMNSRIILDEMGAETLIGKGDMLFVPPGTSQLCRAQGSFVSDDEIETLVKFVSERNGEPNYAQEVQEAIDAAAAEDDEDSGADADDGFGGKDDDPMLAKAWEIIRTTKKASISNLQMRLSIGYGRAKRIIFILEERGFIGADNGPNKPRDILKE